MTQKIKISIIAAMIFCSTAGFAQQDDESTQMAYNKVVEQLKQGNCERAERAYNAWKILSEKTNAYFEMEIADCKDAIKNKLYVELPVANIAVQKEDVSSSELDWKSAVALCNNSILGGYTDWRMPTIDELATLYTNQKMIGNFKQNYYWSATIYDKELNDWYSDISFSSGNKSLSNRTAHLYCRCVRTLKK
jgi:hypothetical protein